jgi:hypothetical protein
MLGGSRVKARSVYELAEDGLVTEQHMREEGREGERGSERKENERLSSSI